MKPSHRIILNIAATYIRSVLGVALALFSSRWVLNAMGKTDFGLFSVVGSIIIFIVFLNAVMSNSAARHYAFYLGKEDTAEVNRWFNTAFSLHVVLGIVLVLLGWLVGEYVITHFLTIPQERLCACTKVFRISLISAFVNMLSVPFIAMYRAKQNIALLSVWGILQSVLTFGLAWYLTAVSSDRLIFYASGMVLIVVTIQATQIIWALLRFKECRICVSYWFGLARLKEIISFASWNLIGNTGTLLRNQGSALLLNLYFGPSANASYGIANQVSTQTTQLANAMMGAFAPEITASEGRGDRDRMLTLSLFACKFGTILLLLFAIPIIVEMDYVLKLWLKNPPENSASLCRLILVSLIINHLTYGNMLAVSAFGKIAGYQATVGGLFLLTLPLAWGFIKLGGPVVSIGWAFVIMAALVTAGRVYWMRRLFGVTVKRWFSYVVIPCFVVLSVSYLTGFTVYKFMEISFARLLIILAGSVFVSLCLTWIVAFSKYEKELFAKIFNRFLSRIKVKK